MSPITAPEIDEAFQSIIDNEEHVTPDDGDHERLSHYVSKEDIIRSSITGPPVYALCGKKWTPRRNPENCPVCPECKTVYEKMRDE